MARGISIQPGGKVSKQPLGRHPTTSSATAPKYTPSRLQGTDVLKPDGLITPQSLRLALHLSGSQGFKARESNSELESTGTLLFSEL